MNAEDHKRAVEDGPAILDMVNRDICTEGGPFVAIRDLAGDSINLSSPSGTKFVAKCVAISSSSVPLRRTWRLI
jgi:hypothetical protein